MNRIKKIEKKINYTVVSNKFLNNEKLSFKAKGVFMYLWSKPDGWKINVKNITNYGTEGDKAVRTAMHELKNLGFIKWVPVQGGYDYFIDDEGGLINEEEVKIKIEEVKKTKSTKKEQIPSFVNSKLWTEYKTMRKQLRKPMTDYAEKQNIKLLETFEDLKEGAANEALKKSICSSWIGLFNPYKTENRISRNNSDTLLEKLKESWDNN